MDRYELADRGADKGLWDWDLTTSRLHYSQGWISMLGVSENECGSTSDEWFKRIHPDDLELVQQEIASHLKKGSPEFEMKHRMLHRDGCYRWMSCQGVVSCDKSGDPVRITGFHADITADIGVDSLTGLPNGNLLLNRLSRAIEKSRRQEDFLYAVLIVDMDLFESGINRLETVNGDALIVAAARRLESALRTKDGFSREGHSDLVARSGSEEFIVLLEGLNQAGEAKTVGARLLKAILAPFAFDGRDVSLSASIGISLSATGYGNPEDAIRDANAALYRAKALGKFRCEIFDTAILESAQSRWQLENDLHEALHRNEFSVFYQPIISLSSNRVEGVEALARWNHPLRGMISPVDFIPLAEKTGLIIPLGRWVLQEACRQLNSWQNDPHISKDLWISVNISAAQFTQPTLAKEIREILIASCVDATRLVLELTEGMAMENPEATRNLLMQLRVMGIKIAIDDFGTGYSSLAHLRRFPLDYLKIDYLFVKSIENKPDAREIIQTIYALAHGLGLGIIAEGIENAEQLNLIRSIGCKYGQGFLYSKPVGSEQVNLMLQDGFAFGENGLPIQPSPDIIGTDAGRSPHPSVQNTSSHPHPTPFSATRPAIKRKWALAGFIILILLFMAGLRAWLNHSTAPPEPMTSKPNSEITGDVPGKSPSSAGITQTNSVVKDGPASPSIPETAYSYPVVHNHRLGSCTGTLKITRNRISFASKKSKDSFNLNNAQYSYALEGNQLTIRSDSRVYRFKSATANTIEENSAELLKITKSLAQFHPAQKTTKH